MLLFRFGPVVEQPYDNRGLPSILDGLPEAKFKSGLIKKIPLLTGVTKHETANGFMLSEVRDKFLSVSDFLKSVSSTLSLEKLLSVLKDLPKIDVPGIPGTGKMKKKRNLRSKIESKINFAGNILKLDDYLKVPEGLDPVKIIAKVLCHHKLFNSCDILNLMKPWIDYRSYNRHAVQSSCFCDRSRME